MRRSHVRGISLVELMVSSALVLLILAEVWMLLQAGTRFYLKVRSQADVQKNALIALRWMSTDLAEGSPLSFKFYNPDNPSTTTDRYGFVFGSPKDLDENVKYNSGGRLIWTSVLGYYIDPESKDLLRSRIVLADQIDSPPQILDSLYHVERMKDSQYKRTIAFKARDIDVVQGTDDVMVTLRFRDEDLGYGLKVQTRLEMKN